MAEPLKVLSLFAGCGGLDLGFKQAGFELVWANEIDPHACLTYKNNIGNHVYEGDIRDIQRDNLPADIDIVIGGFPCQGFSMAGKRDVNDERNFLYREMKRIIGLVKPRFFVAENVRGLISMEKGRVLEKILNDFRELGYHVDYRLLYAPDFGVPQERYRIFIVGTIEEEDIPFPEPYVYPYKTVRETIGDIISLGALSNHEITQKWPHTYNLIMQRIAEGQKLCNSRHGNSSVYTWDIPEVYGEVTDEETEILLTIAKNRRHKIYGPKDGNPLSASVISSLIGWEIERVYPIIESLINKEYLIEKDNKFDITKATFTRFKRLSWDTPSPTVLTNFDNPRNYIHPSENRPLTVREAARIQTFPDEFIFYGPYQKQYTQVGNAVPPLLAYHIAETIKKMNK